MKWTSNVGATSNIYGTTASSSSTSVYINNDYVREELKKPDTPEEWLRSRVKEICELVDLKKKPT